MRDFFMLEEDYEQSYLHQEEKLVDYLEQSYFMLSQMYEVGECVFVAWSKFIRPKLSKMRKVVKVSCGKCCIYCEF